MIYAPSLIGRGVISKVNPNIRFLIMLLGGISISYGLTSSIKSVAVYFVYLLISLYLSKINFRNFINRNKYIMYLVVITFLINVIFNLSITNFILNINHSFQAAIKLLFILELSLIFTMTVTDDEIAGIFLNLMFPLRIIGLHKVDTAIITIIAVKYTTITITVLGSYMKDVAVFPLRKFFLSLTGVIKKVFDESLDFAVKVTNVVRFSSNWHLSISRNRFNMFDFAVLGSFILVNGVILGYVL